MAELDKTISVIESWLKQPVLTPPPINELYDALELLKEQDDMGKELGDAIELIHKKNERIEQLNRFVNGFSRDAMPVVRCKDCIHRGNSEKCVLSAISEEKDFPLFMLDNRGDWFCADGVAKDKNVLNK